MRMQRAGAGWRRGEDSSGGGIARATALASAAVLAALLSASAALADEAGWPATPGDIARAGAADLVLVQDGQARAAIWRAGDGAAAAEELAVYIEKISGAAIEIRAVQGAREVPAGEPAICAGSLARELGLAAPPPTASGDGYRLLRKGSLLLLAGETDASTGHAACHLLEILGCRWFFDNPLGEVVPRRPTIAIGALDVAEAPDFLSRSIWGPNWHGTAWKRRNRLGGISLPTGHDWQWLPADRHGAEHPEYYALRGGERRPGAWLCTSNPEVRKLFAEAVAAAVAGKGRIGLSISPPDGTGYCECEACRVEDVAGYIEPSSGRVAVTDRYMEFFRSVALEVEKVNPEAILSFYAYADYSLPPRRAAASPGNLCAWIAPIRFCRLHSLENPHCASRRRCREVLEGWSRAVSRIGWREYNYNLAEATVPISKISVWRDDFPLLKKLGCAGINIECLALWHLYGPHTYLAARLAWDSGADVDAILDDLYEKLFGAAAPHVRSYWERIDRACRDARAHAGSFYSLHVIWTRALLDACREDLDRAGDAAGSDVIRARIAMFREGLESAELYAAVRDATARCEYARAKEIFDRWMEHLDAIHAAGIHPVGEYRRGYAPRFLGRAIEEGAARTSGERRLILRLPDEWLFRYDADGDGERRGWHLAGAPREGWREVKTFSATLNEQGIEEELTWMWYRTSFTAPADLPGGPVHLWFAEIDGSETKVFLDGRELATFRGGRRPHEVEITGRLLPGREQTLSVRIDRRRISELMLGGIIQPVMIYAGPRPESGGGG
ncbi:MAG: DUF4838 domain-containing protein [Planctomycetes bacterium]|nr:DUF4838 domain-containing protein [Planctomycetota bacterium]